MSGVLDVLSIGIVVCAFSLIFLNGTIIVQSIANGLLTAGAITPSMPTYGVFESAINTTYSFDTIVVLLYFGLWIISILAASFLESETINLPLTVFMGVVAIFLSFVISNVMHAVVGNPIFASVIAHFGQTQLLLANLGAFTALFVVVYSIVILARPTFTGNAPGGGGGTSTIIIGP